MAEPLAFAALARGGWGSQRPGLVGLRCHWEAVRVTTRGRGGPFPLVPAASLLAPLPDLVLTGTRGL